MECFSAHPSFFSSETDDVDLRCPICPRFCSCFLQSVFFVLFWLGDLYSLHSCSLILFLCHLYSVVNFHSVNYLCQLLHVLSCKIFIWLFFIYGYIYSLIWDSLLLWRLSFFRYSVFIIIMVALKPFLGNPNTSSSWCQSLLLSFIIQFVIFLVLGKIRDF